MKVPALSGLPVTFIADLHIHSRFSRATSRQLTPHSLAAWACVKGIGVLGTGDFTHPAWRKELQSTLCRDEHCGLFRLKGPTPDDPAARAHAPATRCTKGGAEGIADPLFLLQAEVSSIYKRHGKVRKVHNLVFMPDFDAVERLVRRLEGIGNLASDGRPILGLDSRNLLEMVLEADPQGVVIPAHAWTPWFSIFGSKSGFDSMEECFGDLTPHIFAMETGLSSDPAMNRLWSHLDRYALISNSDAHSPANLGREANIFTGEPGYTALFAALRREASPCAFAGTVEFFPEEGKYHLDGHRACNVVLEPEETRALRNLCPVCGKPLTIGVLHRVQELADRDEPALPEASEKPGFVSLVPLAELLGELLGVGPKSRKVAERYATLVRDLGSELEILRSMPENDLRHYWEGLGEGIARMRRGQVIRQGGYDGEYGVVRVFTPQEAASLRAGRASLTGWDTGKPPSSSSAPPPAPPRTLRAESVPSSVLPVIEHAYSPEQRQVMEAGPQPVLVMAGPGAGKTHTLMGRIAHLLRNGVPAQNIMTITFTRRAAEELRQRATLTAPEGPLPFCDTLHAWAWAELRRQANAQGQPPPVLLSEESARHIFAQAHARLSAAEIRSAWDALSLTRERRANLPPELQSCLDSYGAAKAQWKAVDFTDLLEQWLDSLENGRATAPWWHILVDEVQDLSPLQWQIITLLLPHDGQGFFGIGDPDQAIYGFRGAQDGVADHLADLWPSLQVFSLTRSWRSAESILDCATHLMRGHGHCGPLKAARPRKGQLHLFEAPSAEAEARWVAERIAALLGGTSHTLADRADTQATDYYILAPGDMAVLVRTKAQMPILRRALEQRGIPCAVPEEEGCWHDSRIALILEQAALACADAPLLTGGRVNAPAWPPTLPAVWRGGLAALRRHLHGQPGFDALFWESAAWRTLESIWQEGPTWPDALARLHLLRDVEMARQKAERVQLITLHAAKGLEFQAVFLPGLEEGLLPLRRDCLYGTAPCSTPANDAEERRLLYVGITRAAERVYASYARQRQWLGRTLHLSPSSLLEALRPHCRSTVLAAHSRNTATQLRLL